MSLPGDPEGKCCRKIGDGEAKTIARVRFDVGDFMIGVQWYTKGAGGLYEIQSEIAPYRQNSTELAAVDVDVTKDRRGL